MLSSKRVYVIMAVSGLLSKPVWTKSGKGFFCPDAAEKKAKALAEKNPDTRYYVMATVSAFQKAPSVTSKTYGGKKAAA